MARPGSMWVAAPILGVLMIVAGDGSAHAAMISYFLDQSNQTSVLPNGADYLEVTLTSTGAAVDVTVDTLSALNQYASTGFGLDSFGFDTQNGADAITAANITGLPSDWMVKTNSSQNGFGKFDLVPQTNGSGNRVSELDFQITPVTSGGATSIDQTLTDYVVLSSGNAGDGNQFFAAHVAGFTINGSQVNSAFFGGSTEATPVPLPATAWLLLSALGGWGALARRRQTAQAAAG